LRSGHHATLGRLGATCLTRCALDARRVEEILDLRYVILPKHRRVWFDKEEGLIHFDEEIELVGQAD